MAGAVGALDDTGGTAGLSVSTVFAVPGLGSCGLVQHHHQDEEDGDGWGENEARHLWFLFLVVVFKSLKTMIELCCLDPMIDRNELMLKLENCRLFIGPHFVAFWLKRTYVIRHAALFFLQGPRKRKKLLALMIYIIRIVMLVGCLLGLLLLAHMSKLRARAHIPTYLRRHLSIYPRCSFSKLSKHLENLRLRFDVLDIWMNHWEIDIIK